MRSRSLPGDDLVSRYSVGSRLQIQTQDLRPQQEGGCGFYLRQSFVQGKVGVDHGVFHVITSCVFATSFHRFFYSRSAHLAISVVALHLCWWPPILCRRCGALPVWRRVSPVFPFLSLLLVGRGLPGSYVWAYRLFVAPSLLVCLQIINLNTYITQLIGF